MPEPKDFTVLVVDDEEMLRATLEATLKRQGYNVVTAANGKDALKIVHERKIHLVLSDIRMPDGDGLTLLEQIRALDPKIPVVFLMTGFSDQTHEECISMGAKGVFSKPFDRAAVLKCIREALGIPNAKAA